MIITIFEDQDYKSLFPLNINRASFELRCGAFTNIERVQNLLSPEDSIQLIVRNELVPLIKARYPNITVNPNTVSSGIWLNGRGLWTDRLLKEIAVAAGMDTATADQFIRKNKFKNKSPLPGKSP